MSSKKFNTTFLIIQIATVAVFWGRAWQHIIWDAPFRTLLWDEAWMTTILPWFTSMAYEDFITNIEIDDAIQNWIKGFGWFYFVCGWITIFIKRIPKFFTHLLWVGAFSLMILAFLYCKEKFFQWGQFWEYSLQFGAPLFLFYLLKKRELSTSLIFIMKVAVAITFVSHGLYALNYYPRPGHFTQMVIDILGVQESTAVQFLNLAGILDFALAIGIFIKGKVARAALAYAVFWGFATTAARIWGHFYVDMIEDTLMMWVHEAVYRIPHFLIPLALFFIEKDKH